MKTFLNRICLTVAMLLSVLTVSAYDFEVDGIYYDANVQALTATVVRGENLYSGDIVIPATVMHKNRDFVVTAVAEGVFEGCEDLSSIVLPNSVISLGSGLFSGCKNLGMITLPSDINILPKKCFYDCYKLSSVSLPNSIESIGDSCFENCIMLEEIIIPSTAHYIGTSAFAGCNALESVFLPESLTQLNKRTFYGCTTIETVNLPDALCSIEEETFMECNNLKSIVIPCNVENIGDQAFDNCYSLSAVVFDDGDKVLELGKGRKVREDYCCGLFADSRLSQLYVGRNLTYPSYDGAIFLDGLTIGFSPFEYTTIENLTIGPKVTRIPNHCFLGLKKISQITIPKNVVSIGVAAFAESDFSSLIIEGSPVPLEFDYPENNTDRPLPTAFAKCNCLELLHNSRNLVVNLTGVDTHWWWSTDTFFPISISDVTIDGFANEISFMEVYQNHNPYTLAHYPNLAKLTLGGLIRYLPNVASNTELKELTICSQSPLQINGNTTFSNAQYMDLILNVPKGSKSNYEEAEGWKLFWNIQEIDGLPLVISHEGLKYIPYAQTTELCLVGSEHELTGALDIPMTIKDADTTYTVKSVGTVLANSDIASISLPESIEEMYPESFMNCKQLKSASLPNVITQIGDRAFSGCEALQTINLPKSLVRIGKEAFQDCLSLHELIIPSQTYDFGQYAFKNCKIQRLIFEDSDLPLSFPHGAIHSKSLPGYDYLMTYSSYFGETIIKQLYLGRDLEPMPTPYVDGHDYYVFEDPFFGLESIETITVSKNVSRIGTDKEEPISWRRLINSRSFDGCRNIKVVTVETMTPPRGADFGTEVYANATLIIPIDNEAAYYSADGWREFSNILTFTGEFKVIDEISFTFEDVAIFQNSTLQLTTDIYPQDASIKELIWASSDPSIVEVSSDGLLTSGNKVGEAVVTATTMDGSNLTASVTVKVVDDSGVEDIKTENVPSIKVKNGDVYLSDKSPEDIVSVYDIQGHLMLTTKVSIIKLDSTGVFIIKVAGNTYKVVL